jgi:hypothetical protein
MTAELTPPIALVPGQRYLAKLQLTGLEAMFATTGAVRDKLATLGFHDVSVWNSNPPARFPDRSSYPDGSTFWAQGTYAGPPQQRIVPRQVKRVWIDTAPTRGAPSVAQTSRVPGIRLPTAPSGIAVAAVLGALGVAGIVTIMATRRSGYPPH